MIEPPFGKRILVKLEFRPARHGFKGLVSEAEVVFGEGPFAGAKLVGFSLWSSPAGETYVTFPSRAVGSGEERRYFDYLRSVDGTGDAIRRIKAWILDEYRKRMKATISESATRA